MTVKKVGNRYAVVRKDGSLGKGRFKTKAKAQSAQAKGRALAKANPISKSRNPSSGSSGGGSTAASSSKKAPGIGVTYRRFRTAANVTAGAWGRLLQPGTHKFEDRISDVARRYVGLDPRTGVVDAGPVIENAKGIGVSLANDWVDRKLGNSARLTRGKFAQIAVEGLPWLRARIDAGATQHPFYVTAVNWNKRTTGFDPQNGGFQLGRVEEYAVTKAIAGAWDKFAPKGLKRSINDVFGKGINPA